MSRAEFSASLRGGGWGNIAYGCDAGRCRYGCGYAGMGVGRQAGEGADAESTCQKFVMVVGMDFVSGQILKLGFLRKTGTALSCKG